MTKTCLLDRYEGCLIGLAVGDALGHPIESRYPGTFEPITRMEPSPHFGVKGLWTDDTSQALCLAFSLLYCHGFDAHDQLSRYLAWYRNGFCSSVGHAFGTGSGTRSSLEYFEATGATKAINGAKGNGCIMRLAPIPMYFFHNDWMPYAYRSAELTHGDDEAKACAMLFSDLIHRALLGEDKETILEHRTARYPNRYSTLNFVLAGSYKKKNPPEIKADRTAVGCLEAALWAFYHTDSFKEGVLKAINLGHDTDTVGAVYGQLAGAYYGFKTMPRLWYKQIHQGEHIRQMANELYHSKVPNKE